MSTTSLQRTSPAQGERLRAGRLALAAGLAIFAGKFTAYSLTGSTAVFADAIESTVNIAAAGMLLFALRWAAQPPDRDHPYGHGRIEFLSAGIEGAAITVAALVILAESVRELIQGPRVSSLDVGLGMLALCTVANGLLARHLIDVGQRTDSLALVADGRHLLTDVWTSVGVIAGLAVVWLTGFVWADPLIAIAVALHVVREGASLLRKAFGSLMDEADEPTLEAAARVLEARRGESWIDVHGLRSRRSGARRHFDLHLTVPRFLDVDAIHAIHTEIESALLENDPETGDVVVHFDPCEPSLCHRCAMSACAIREVPFERAPPFDADSLVRTDEELECAGVAAGQGT